MTEEPTSPLLQVRGLRVETDGGNEIVGEVSFDLSTGEVLALVGESGCGKSTVALALLGYAREGSRITAGEVSLRGSDILELQGSDLRRARGSWISYVPQDPSTRLSPRRTLRSQMVEALTIHGTKRDAALERTAELLRAVGLPDTRDF